VVVAAHDSTLQKAPEIPDFLSVDDTLHILARLRVSSSCDIASGPSSSNEQALAAVLIRGAQVHLVEASQASAPGVPRVCSVFQVLVEQLEGAFPSILRILGAINVGARVIEEAVRASRVHFDLALLAEFL
jgi:hypothetical protein